jgi:hypothetical protein
MSGSLEVSDCLQSYAVKYSHTVVDKDSRETNQTEGKRSNRAAIDQQSTRALAS